MFRKSKQEENYQIREKNYDDLRNIQRSRFFRNCDSSKIKPHIREMVGWLCYENIEALCILSDKPVKPIKMRARKILESGFVILKSDILERVYFDMGKNLKRLRKEVIQGANALKRRKKKNAKADHC